MMFQPILLFTLITTCLTESSDKFKLSLFAPTLAVQNQSFTMVCQTSTVKESSAIRWSVNGSSIGIVHTGNCQSDAVRWPLYKFSCSEKNVSVTIPGSSMNDSLHRSVWRCSSVYGGSSNFFTLHINVPVQGVSFAGTHRDAKIVDVKEGQRVDLQCITEPCRPPANISLVNRTEEDNGFSFNIEETGGLDMSVTIGRWYFDASVEDNGRIVWCEASNIQGYYNVASGGLWLHVLYGPGRSVSHTSESESINITIHDALEPVNCSARCNPECSIEWWKDGKIISKNAYLGFKNVTRDQGGIYICYAKNTVGMWHTELRVNVMYQPIIEELTTKEKEISENEEVEIKCKVDSYPFPDVKWSRNSVNIPSCNLNVASDGSVTTSTKEISENEEVEIKCKVDSYPFPDVKWSRNSVNIPSCNLNVASDGSVTTSTLFIKHASCLDAGNYTCVAKNGIELPVSMMIQLFVKCKPRLDERILQHIQHSQQVLVGSNVSINATYIAYPEPKVHWYRVVRINASEQVLSLSPKTDSVEFWQESKLFYHKYGMMIYHINYDSFGDYILEAKNKYGTPTVKFSIQEKVDRHRTINLYFWIYVAAVLLFVILALGPLIYLYRKKRTDKTKCGTNENEDTVINEDIRMTLDQEIPDDNILDLRDFLLLENDYADYENQGRSIELEAERPYNDLLDDDPLYEASHYSRAEEIEIRERKAPIDNRFGESSDHCDSSETGSDCSITTDDESKCQASDETRGNDDGYDDIELPIPEYIEIIE